MITEGKPVVARTRMGAMKAQDRDSLQPIFNAETKLGSGGVVVVVVVVVVVAVVVVVGVGGW